MNKNMIYVKMISKLKNLSSEQKNKYMKMLGDGKNGKN